MTRDEIYKAVDKEREAQDREHGGPAHDDAHNHYDWIVFVTKHLGRSVTGGRTQFIKQMVRVAALAVAAVEWATRGEERGRSDW
jgi:hypothetical protein